MADVQPCCVANLNKMLIDMVGIFNEAQLHYWLDWGALLGLVRSGELCPWDHDIDFGLFEEDIPKYNALRPAVEAKGYDFYDIVPEKFFSKDDFVPRVHLKPDAHCWRVCACDMFVWTKVRKRWADKAIMINTHKFIYCDLSYYEKLEKLTWRGVEISVPSKTIEYIQLRYGHKWLTPNPHFLRDGGVHQVGVGSA